MPQTIQGHIQPILEELDITGIITDDCSLRMIEEIEPEKFVSLVQRLGQEDTRLRFFIGDLMNQGFNLYGEEAFQLFGKSEWEEGTLKNYGRIAKGIPAVLRRADVEWSHYAEIYSIKDRDLQEKLIEECAQGNMTVKDLREYKGNEGDGDSPIKGVSYNFVIEPETNEAAYKGHIEDMPGVYGKGESVGECAIDLAWELKKVLDA